MFPPASTFVQVHEKSEGNKQTASHRTPTGGKGINIISKIDKLSVQVNYYERSLELMRQSMEVERKDISQAFKVTTSQIIHDNTRTQQLQFKVTGHFISDT